MKPLVTVIGISYNHEAFIKEALESLWRQSYENIELILLDDASTDQSQNVINDLISDRPDILFIRHNQNLGYTSTFNQGLAQAKGEFIIDFALDDVMLPDFIEKSVAALESAGKDYGVSFSNAVYINAQSEETDNHLEQLLKKDLIKEMPQGDVFEMILKRYFVCTPTMVIKREVFDRLGGYDTDLAFEDFDFWVRSSRYFKYTYIDEVLMKKRKLKTSMSANRYRHWENNQLRSVLSVCQKAFALCKTKKELKALRSRVFYEYRQVLRADFQGLSKDYEVLYQQAGGNKSLLLVIRILLALGVDFRRG